MGSSNTIRSVGSGVGHGISAIDLSQVVRTETGLAGMPAHFGAAGIFDLSVRQVGEVLMGMSGDQLRAMTAYFDAVSAGFSAGVSTVSLASRVESDTGDSDSVGSPGTEVSANSSASSSKARRRARARRAKAVKAAVGASVQAVEDRAVGQSRAPASDTSYTEPAVVRSDVDGWCYLAMFRKEHRAKLADDLGEYPTFASLLNVRLDMWVDDWAMMGVSRAAPGSYHVSKTGMVRAEKCFYSVALQAYGPEVFLAGSIGRHLQGCQIELEAVMLKRAPSIMDRVGGHSPYRPGVQTSEQAKAIAKSYLDSGTLEAWILGLCGVDIAHADRRDVVCATSGASMLSSPDRDRSRVMQVAGDSVITLVVAMESLELKYSVEQFQAARSALTSNVSLSELFVKRFPQHLFKFAADVFPGKGKVGANSLEAVVGLVMVAAGIDQASEFVRAVGVLELWKW